MRYKTIGNGKSKSTSLKRIVIIDIFVLCLLLLINFSLVTNNEILEIIIFIGFLYTGVDIISFLFSNKELLYLTFDSDSILLEFDKAKYNVEISHSNLKLIHFKKSSFIIKTNSGKNYELDLHIFDHETVQKIKEEINELKSSSKNN